MAARINGTDSLFLEYLVPELILGLPRRGRPCPSPAGTVTSYFDGSPPTLETGFHADSSETLNTYSSSESVVLLPRMPRWAEQIPNQPGETTYGSIGRERSLEGISRRVANRRLCYKILKIALLSILLTSILFYATGHGYKIYMELDLSELVNFISMYKYYIIASYIGVIMLGFGLGWGTHLIVQKYTRESPLLTRSWSLSLLELNQENVN